MGPAIYFLRFSFRSVSVSVRPISPIDRFVESSSGLFLSFRVTGFFVSTTVCPGVGPLPVSFS